ncbi:MAG: RluA family pseudouridine synthase [Pirellulales bacterium]
MTGQTTPVPVDILYEDGPCLVVFKPPGLLTQAPPGIDSLEVRVKELLRARDGRSGQIYLGVANRIDRPASGALIMSKHARAARRVSEQFEARTVEKLYWACTEGVVEPAEGTWEDFVYKVPGHAEAAIVPAGHPAGRKAILHYRTLGQTPHGSLLEIRLETGRTHQIRIQAASRGWPILGDAQYGATVPFGEQYDDERLRAIALHARSLRFQHPVTREPVHVTSAPLEPWDALLG